MDTPVATGLFDGVDWWIAAHWALQEISAAAPVGAGRYRESSA